MDMKKVNRFLTGDPCVGPGFPALLAALFAVLALQAHGVTLEGLSGTPNFPSATPIGRFGLTVGLGASGHADELLIRDRTFLFRAVGDVGTHDTAEIQDLQSGSLRLNAVLGVATHFELGLSVPYHIDLTDDTDAKTLTGSGPGDPVFSAKAGFSLAGDHILDMALLGTLSLPSKNSSGFLPKHTGYLVGDSANPAPSRFLSAFAPGYSGRLLFSLDLTRLESQVPFRAHLGSGFKHPGIGNTRFLLGGSMEWVPLPFLGFFLEGNTETRTSNLGQALGKDLALASAGFWAHSDDGMFFSVGLQRRVSKSTYQAFVKPVADTLFEFQTGTAPDLALGVTLGWTGILVAQDLDKDGVPDNQDPCPNEKEDMDGFQDFDGCPDRDNDEDSIPDLQDKCPIEPEDRDGTEDGDGCPDHDNDGDNIPDALDKCPIEVEDLDSFEDYDGCPDLDNDQDGVLDQQDKCTGQAEDKDGFEDTDGCPDPDNDLDKIPDLNDKCPKEPETYNSFEDGDGCPDLSRQGGGLELERRTVLKGVRFRANTTELLTGSYPVLDSLAERLKGSPGVLVEIRGYMDRNGSELEQFRITETWAATVRKYLITQGVQATQILARGMGSRDPIATNTSASGRAQNRRIEAHRLN